MFNKFVYPVVKIFNSILSQNIITCLNITWYKDIAILVAIEGSRRISLILYLSRTLYYTTFGLYRKAWVFSSS